MISCNILDFSDLPEVTTCEGLDENDDDIYSQGLCIPMDRLDELEFFPNFNDDLIALTQPEQDYLKGCDGIELSHDGQQRLEVDLYEKQEGNLDDDNDECLRDGADDQKLNICEEDFQLEANYSDEGEVSDSRLSTQNYTKKRKSDDDDNDDEEQYTYNYTKKRKSGSDNDDYIGDGGVNNDDDCIGDGEISCIFKKPRSKSRRIKRTSGTKSLYWQMFSNYTNMERRCFHCQAEKTPQWRMGPNGPNTLCNACGVRYASGRLLPEYRPAASPTFDSTKHSNFHKRIIRQKKSYVVKKKKKSCTNNAHEEFMNEGV